MLKKKSRTRQLCSLLALLGSLITAGQIGYTLIAGDSFCPADGCRVVEQLTRVSPLVFNLVGFFFFQTVFWVLLYGRYEERRRSPLIVVLLLAALAAEGVLVGFQYFIVGVFCVYCLAILALIVLINLCYGAGQAFQGTFIFAMVLLTFSSLAFNRPNTKSDAFTSGIFASRAGSVSTMTTHLFFSSTCAHCQNVLAALAARTDLEVFFHPIDAIERMDLSGLDLRPGYSPAANKAFLAGLQIDQIPVLVTKTTATITVLQGEEAILAFLGNASSAQADQSARETVSGDRTDIPGLDQKDGCSVISDCEADSGTTSTKPGS